MKILLAGEGGQGIQLAAEVLAHAAFLEGKEASLIPNFGVEQRGGVSLAFVIIGEDASYPKFDKADLLAIFCDRAYKRIKRYIDSKTRVIYGPAMSEKISHHSQKILSTRDLPDKVWNILVLGEILRLTQIVKKKSLEKALQEKLGEKFAKNPELEALNFKALA